MNIQLENCTSQLELTQRRMISGIPFILTKKYVRNDQLIDLELF